MENPKVSIIMNGHNAEKYLQEAIFSALSQTYLNTEIIFFDNNSNDKTDEIVRSFTDSRIKYYRSSELLSLGEARNRAIQLSTGDFIAFLDCDDIWYCNKLEKQIPIFDDQKVGIVISNSIFFNQKGALKKLYKFEVPPQGQVFQDLINNYFISLETAVIRRTALNSLDHWFDDRFSMIEEYDLFIRLAYYWELKCIPAVLAKWRVHSSSWTWSRRKLFIEERKLFKEKLVNSFPQFTPKNFPKEYRSLDRLIAWEKSRDRWVSGDKKSAQKIIKEYRYDSMRWFFIYVLMIFKISIVRKILKVIGKEYNLQ